mmetsp:Transcript_11962/g.17258  ORF Transcript_11962/g.17258 Transcript_11962/m.17258 type:complete len:110 (+) Transcript_11962:1614-1943(+)
MELKPHEYSKAPQLGLVVQVVLSKEQHCEYDGSVINSPVEHSVDVAVAPHEFWLQFTFVVQVVPSKEQHCGVVVLGGVEGAPKSGTVPLFDEPSVPPLGVVLLELSRPK